MDEAIDCVVKLTDIPRIYGLEINKTKRNMKINNIKDQPDNIEGMKVQKRIKYT